MAQLVFYLPIFDLNHTILVFLHLLNDTTVNMKVLSSHILHLVKFLTFSKYLTFIKPSFTKVIC
jgi:hypothetical protein